MNQDQKISDYKQRQSALDYTKSFIVQAPAGSGKTAILVQRYLTLLTKVKTPEEIIAITFTRKAAAEMRHRIIRTITQAQTNQINTSQYDQDTQKIALEVIKQNDIHGWDIIQNPSRLRIQTIDSFCHYLTHQTPILTKFGNIKIVTNHEAENYYTDAATLILENLTDPEYADDLKTLLIHLDNNWSLAENLFINMLRSRELWLPHIMGLKNIADLRKNLERSLQAVAQENLEYCIKFFPPKLQEELKTLLVFAKENQENPPDFLHKITTQEFFAELKLTTWKNLAEFLLTKEFTWRKQVTKKHGFPPQNQARTKEEKKLFGEMKSRMENLLIEFSDHENFRGSLENLLYTPPLYYTNNQWKIIETLLKIVPLLVAQLKVLFNKHHVADIAEITMAALGALGYEHPSDLALNLDYKLQHILIDEFQDTSLIQYTLLEKLTSAWQEGDGRTLFLVGDPMQSIYRFRGAEVGIFLRAWNEGIGPLKLHPITLTTNFRTTENIISWVNDNFTKIFPTLANIGYGAVEYQPSAATKKREHTHLKIELLKNSDDLSEAKHIIAIIKKINQQDPKGSIAVLVKARNHLKKITGELARNHFEYQAHEIESLAQSTVIEDLFSLTRALFHLADRIAWLAILRAPWCGLHLDDIYKLANGPSKIIWDNVCSYPELNLSADGQKRTEKFKNILTRIIPKIRRVLWHELIEETWLELGGAAVVLDETELEYAKIYLKLIEKSSMDLVSIKKQISELYKPSVNIANIHVMTIHKAKGLEFDHVIIPGINKTTQADEHKLILLHEHPMIHHGSCLLVAPLMTRNSIQDPVYQYLRIIEQKKDFYETGRLLYVAITRAKTSVHITGCVKYDKETMRIIDLRENSFLRQMLECFNSDWFLENTGASINETPSYLNSDDNKNLHLNNLYRLTNAWVNPITKKAIDTNIDQISALTDGIQTPKQPSAILGTAIHYCMKQLCFSIKQQEKIDKKYIDNNRLYWCKLLKQLGYPNIENGLQILDKAINSTIEDQRGQWLLYNYPNSECELEISTIINKKLKKFIIDRTFVDHDDVRWIIDYKTSSPENEDINSFFLQEQKKYESQLLVYVKIMQELEKTRKIKSGLYFPLFKGWIECQIT